MKPSKLSKHKKGDRVRIRRGRDIGKLATVRFTYRKGRRIVVVVVTDDGHRNALSPQSLEKCNADSRNRYVNNSFQFTTAWNVPAYTPSPNAPLPDLSGTSTSRIVRFGDRAKNWLTSIPSQMNRKAKGVKSNNINQGEVVPPTCPQCRSNKYVRRKERRLNLYSNRTVFKCYACGKKITPRSDSTKIPNDCFEEIEELRFRQDCGLAGIQERITPKVCRSTISNAMRRRGNKCALLVRQRIPELRGKWGCQINKRKYYYMLVDSTSFSGGGYLDACVDDKSRDVVGHQFVEFKDEKEALLRQVEADGYHPDLIVLDEDPTWIRACEEVFPNAKMQFCLFHLKKRLNEKLPTRHKRKGTERRASEKLKLWRFLKSMIGSIVDALDLTTSTSLKNSLEGTRASWEKDREARPIVEDFLKNLFDHYLLYLSFPMAPNTTNHIEHLFREIKMRKAVTAARTIAARSDYINIIINRKRLELLNKTYWSTATSTSAAWDAND